MSTVNEAKGENNVTQEGPDHVSGTASIVNSIHDITVTPESEWEREKSMYNSIGKVGIQTYANDNKVDIQSGVYNKNNKLHTRSCVCMDERTINFGLNLAGSGILLDFHPEITDIEENMEANLVTLSEIIVEINKDHFEKTGENKIDTITSHQGCGAAAIYANEKGITQDADEIGKVFSQRLAEKTELKYEYLELDIPHTARSIYVDFTGEFSEEPATLPNGYNIAADEGFLDHHEVLRNHIVPQAEVAYQIAKDKVYGEKITPENPFFVFIVKQDGLEMDKNIILELEALKEKYNNEVKIDYLEIPKKAA